MPSTCNTLHHHAICLLGINRLRWCCALQALPVLRFTLAGK